MKVKHGRRIVVVCSAILLLVIPLGTVALTTDIFGGRDRPPRLIGVEHGDLSSTSICENPMVTVDEGRQQFLLGYLDGFVREVPEDANSADEIARITRKNEQLKAYRNYVAGIAFKTMPETEYNQHYEHLEGIIHELVKLEPPPAPRERLTREVGFALMILEQELVFSKVNGEAYVKAEKLNVPFLEEVIADLNSLKTQVANEEVELTQLQDAYETCLEKMKVASPYKYIVVIKRCEQYDAKEREWEERHNG